MASSQEALSPRATAAADTLTCDASNFCIAVLGSTGSGKSNLISKCTGELPLQNGDGLLSVTKSVTVHALQRCDRDIRLIDTPGFNDTECSDVNTVKEIAYWLADASRKNLCLSGAIWTYDCASPRFTGTDLRALRILKAACGKKFFRYITVVATRCDEVPPGLLEDRLDWLRREHWGDVIDAGGRVARSQNSRESALRIVDELVQRGREEEWQLQQEMVRQCKTLKETAVGTILYEHHLELCRMVERRIDEMTALMATESSQRGDQTRMEVRRMMSEGKQNLEAHSAAMQSLQVETSALVAQLSDKLAQRSSQMNVQLAAAQAELRGLTIERRKLQEAAAEDRRSEETALAAKRMREVNEAIARRDRSYVQLLESQKALYPRYMPPERVKSDSLGTWVGAAAGVAGVVAQVAAGGLLCTIM